MRGIGGPQATSDSPVSRPDSSISGRRTSLAMWLIGSDQMAHRAG
jgi:hypothetical protein